MVGSFRRKIFLILAVLVLLSAAASRLGCTDAGAATHSGETPWVQWAGARFLPGVFLVACIGTLAGAVALLERWVLLPVSRLQQALWAMASGDWQVRVPVQGPAEVQALYSAFNRAAEAVASSVRQARAEKAFSEALLTSLPVGILALDRDLRVLTCNEAFRRMLKADASTLEGKRLAEILPCPRLLEKVGRALEDGQPREEMCACLEDVSGHDDPSGPRRLNLMVQPVYRAAASERGAQLLIVAEDVTERERSREERDRVASILEATTDFVITTDPEGRVRYVNRAARQALGIMASTEEEGASILSWYPEEERDLMRRERIPQAIRLGVWSGESTLKAANGSTIPVSQVMLAHRDGDGNVSFLSLILRDISDRKDFESRLSYLADHDPLTGLFNRRRFEQELERALTQSPPSRARGALLFIDLDNFKFINDEFGHPVGDEILQSTARVLRSRLDGKGILSRLGGDEFMVILPDAGAAEAAAVAEHLLEGMRHGVLQMGNRLVRLSASIGGVLFPEHGVTVEGLLARADRAMYRAKKEGKNAYALFSPYQDWPEPIRMNALWERRIRQALSRDQFLLFAQPIVDARTGKVFCHELLLRMRDEHGILVPPSRFLGIAEQSDLIHHIDRWVVRKAIQFLGEHRDAGYRLEVNLSGKAFLDDELLELIRGELASSGADPEQLIFEITETSAVMDVDRAKSLITTLQSLGCAFALDDFGAGFSSFFHLKHLPVDYLKIDGSFIQNLPRDRQNQHIVRAMVEAARGSNMLTVAEFVGDAVTMDLLREIGVDYLQGYYVGAPRPLSDLEAVRSAR